jgi:site-specific DNA-methyltransferase (adenine-specific)
MQITNEDNMQLMSRYPDKYFDLAIVDPPYGILNKTKRGSQRSPHKYKVRAENWDFAPNEEYFHELFRVSKNQIICGGNYFKLPLTQSWIFWYKHQPVANYAKGELFWTSFDKPLQCFDFMYYGNINSDKNRFHPTQKPVSLYCWLLQNYATQGDKILDTHLGSGSIAIACHDLGYELTACELDTDYYNSAMKRIEDHKKQLVLF